MAYKYLKPYTSFFENVTIYKRYFEFVVAEISQLKNYLNMSPLDKGKDLLYHHSHIIDQYLDWILSKARELEDDKMVSLIDDYEWDNVVVRLLSKKEYHEVADDILGGVYVHARSFDIPDEELPSWWFFDDPQIIKNQWLIHFTNKNPIDIQKQGFQRLESDITYLGLTALTDKTSPTRSHDGYGFSYLLSDYKKYGKSRCNSRCNSRSEWRYGDNAVVFKASGIRVFHSTDEEYQTIFKGDTVKDIVPISHDRNNGTYQIENKKNHTIIYENEELEKVVKWVVDNYNQYKNIV